MRKNGPINLGNRFFLLKGEKHEIFGFYGRSLTSPTQPDDVVPNCSVFETVYREIFTPFRSLRDVFIY
jgi:hypothetical protein